MNHGGWAIPLGINPYSMVSIIKSLTPVWRRVTPVSDFQATLGYEYPYTDLEGISGQFGDCLFRYFSEQIVLNPPVYFDAG